MSFLSVVPDKFSDGVACEEDDWREPPGSPANRREFNRRGRVTRGVSSRFVPTAVDRALSDEYATDAHCVSYYLVDAAGRVCDRMPRVNKSGLPFVESLGYRLFIDTLVVDVDNPDHVEWTPELMAAATKVDALAKTAGVYYTTHGRRFVQPLLRPVRIENAEGVLSGYMRFLMSLGLDVDVACQDWTRHMRLPHVKRDGRRYESIVDMSRMVAIGAPDMAPPLKRRRAAVTAGALRRATGDASLSPLGLAFAAAGWLGRSLGTGKVAALCPWASGHSMGTPFDSSTILFAATDATPLGHFYCSHQSCAAHTTRDAIALLPPHARALIPEVTPPAAPEHVRELLDAAGARARLEAGIREAPDGLSVLVAGCGVGKTEAAIAVATERAKAKHEGKDAKGERAPAHSKTAISVPTTKLAVEIVERVRARGEKVARIFGPLSMRNDDGSPVCRIHEAASLFGAGGLSVPWELCEGRGKEPCEFAATCAARGGLEGPSDARILIGPHKLLAKLDAGAGKTGLLVIDEPPPLLAHHELSADALYRCERGLAERFEHRYAAAMAPSLDALATFVATGPLDAPRPLRDCVVTVRENLLVDAQLATGGTDALECADRALADPRFPAPPVQRHQVHAAKRSPKVARDIGETSRVARIVHSSLTGDTRGTIARVEERRGRRVLIVTEPEIQLRSALRREGRVIVADAGGHEHVELYERVTGSPPPLVEAYMRDGAPVARTWIKRRASRAAWLDGGKVRAASSLPRAIASLVQWANSVGPQRWALVTFLPVELALRAALGEDVAERWAGHGQDAATLAGLVERLAPVLGRLKVAAPDLGHYGALRGLDHWKGHDALATLGDPWGQPTDAKWESQLLGLAKWESRLEAAARGELEQAHGRLRTPHRTAPAAACHVGALLPGGWRLDAVTVQEDAGGAPETAVDIRDSESPSEAAARAGVSLRTMYRRLSERRSQ